MLDVGVELGGGDAGVPQQFLQGPQLGSPRQQVRRKTVPQRVGRGGRRKAKAKTGNA